MQRTTHSARNRQSKRGCHVVKIERVRLLDIIFDEKNERIHEAQSVEAIRASLRKFGQRKPIVIDQENKIVAGHGLVEAAIAEGWSHVDAVRTALEGDQRAAYRIADNRTAEFSSFDVALLAKQINENAITLDGLYEELQVTKLLAEPIASNDVVKQATEQTQKSPTVTIEIAGVPPNRKNDLVAAINQRLDGMSLRASAY